MLVLTPFYREDLNILVKRHIQLVVSASPPRAIATLENDASELIASGMVTLNAKLTGVDDEKLVARVVEIWGFFWDQVLTYLEGVSQLTSFFPPPCLNPCKYYRFFCHFKRTLCYHHYTVPPNPTGQPLQPVRVDQNLQYPHPVIMPRHIT